MKQSLTFRFIASLLICCLSAGTSFGQNTFQKTYGSPGYYNDLPNYIINTTGGYVMAGRESFLMKINPAGDILWQKDYDLGSPVDVFYHVVEANDGGFLAIGESNWIGDDGYLLLIKTDADGNVQWQKRMGDHLWQTGLLGYHILPVPGGYVLSGGFAVFQSHEDGVMIRIDNDGNVLWKHLYSCSPADTRLVAQFIKGDTLFASGHRDTSGAFALINATTGNLMSVQSFDGPSLYDKSLDYMALATNGDFLLAGHVYTPIGNPRMQWVCRISSSGELKWSKTYPNVGAGRIIPLSDGHFLLTPVAITTIPASERDATLLKINGDGEVVWSYKYGITGPNSDYFTSALEAPDGGIVAAGWIRTPGIPQSVGDIMVVKTDSSGRVAGCCLQPVSTTAMPYPPVIYPSTLNQAPHLDTMELAFLQTMTPSRTAQDFCPPGPPEQVFKEVVICPGDSVLINGTFYAAPETVMDTIPGTSCDTVVTYTIQYADTGGASSVSMQCPADIVVQVPAGASSTPVDFDLPSAQSDCVCPGVEIAQTQGLASGSDFAAGVHNICYQGRDSCGNLSACCFQISVVEEEDACDVKTNGCVTFELIRITRNAAWQRTYHIRVTNNCAQPLVYAAFQAPDGILADAPANNETYIAPSGRQYVVRNPNFSPFYSVRYTAQGIGIQDGASDVFRYTLPPQSAPDYIHAMIKTGNQSYMAAHLNTFNCPVEFDSASPGPVEERSFDAPSDDIALFPNPTTGVLFADMKSFSGAIAQIRIFSAQGNLVFAKQIEMKEQILRVDLPTGVASGLYLFEIMDSGGGKQVKRFVVH